MKKLDDEYGPTPDWSRLDPSHLHAIGTRIQTLADQIQELRSEGMRRDDKIDAIKRTADEVEKELSILVRAQMNDADITTLNALIESYRRRTWLWERTIKYLGWFGATAAFFWLFRDPIGWTLGRLFGVK